jgi:hypothetical protein|tara:strand:- start:1424 stop:2002 length:579 start_codon:yes stop_codon:yes gene_type:complete
MLIFSDRFNQRLEDFFKAVKKQSRQNLSKGTKLQRKKRPINKTKKLYNSIQYKKLFENNDSLAYGLFMEDYGDYIDKGVKGTKSNYRVNKNTPYKYTTKRPPSLAISGWAKKSNIRFRNAKGQFEKGNYKSIGYVIAKSIYEKGIRANNFFTIPFVNEFKKLPNDLQDIFADDLIILMIDSMIEAELIKRGN